MSDIFEAAGELSGRDHFADADPVMERIGIALDKISAAGFSEIHGALAVAAKGYRRDLRRTRLPFEKAKMLTELMVEVEELARRLS